VAEKIRALKQRLIPEIGRLHDCVNPSRAILAQRRLVAAQTINFGS
jgi:hypothetical protein